MKTSENTVGKILVGTGMMALISVALMAGITVITLNGILPIERLGLAACVIHFAAVYLGSLICCYVAKEKKGVCAGIGTVCWYVMLLFISVVLLDCEVGNIVSRVVAGLSGYGAALLTFMAPKRKRKNRTVKFPSR